MGANTVREAISGARDVAATRSPNTLSRVCMGTLAKTAVDAVQGALDWNVRGAIVHLALSTSILWVALASPVVAPSSCSTIVQAGADTAIVTAKTGFTPASPGQTQPIIAALVDAKRLATVVAAILWGALTLAIHTGSPSSTVSWAALQRAPGTGPSTLALAHVVDTLATRRAIAGATSESAIPAGSSLGTVAGSVVAIAMVRAAVGAGEERAIQAHVSVIAVAGGIDAFPVSRAVVGTDSLGAIITRPPGSAIAGAVETVTMSKAVIGAHPQLAVGTSESRVTGTDPIVAMLVRTTSFSTASQRAIQTHPTTITDTDKINTCTMAGTVARAL